MMKKAFNITIIIGASLSLLGIILPLIFGFFQTPVGIIGGAGMGALKLQYIFWQRSFYFTITRLGITILICGIIARIFSKTVCQSCTLKSSLLSLGLSASLVCGIYCFASAIRSDLYEKNLSNICGEIGIFVSLFAFIALLIIYLFFYIKDKKYKRIIFDVIVIILFCGVFLQLGNNIENVLSSIF